MHDRNRSLILLPGLDGTGIALRPFLAALPAEVKPIVISYPPDRPLSLGQHAELIRRQCRTTTKLLCLPSPSPDWWR